MRELHPNCECCNKDIPPQSAEAGSGNNFTGAIMEGVQFLTNDRGEKIAVQIDLRKHGDLWEDVYDSLTARKRAKESRESLASVKERLIQQRKLHG